VRDYRCRACRGGPAAEEYSDRNDIVLLRHGAFAKHFGRRSLTADVNHAVFFSQGSTYRVSHPADCGDRGTTFAPAPRVLHDILREVNPAGDDRPERAFPFVTRHGLPRKRHRNGTEADHADRVEAAKTYLASRLGERITLDEVARAVHASPFHLARIFQQQTGVPIHRYLTRLRLRATLERLAEGANDLTALALELGFSSHSHFTNAFRREFGRTPSEVRRGAGCRTLREMSKNVKV
jgi:AraC-like DNA-binding protein